MHTADRFEFAPPPTPGSLRAFVLAVLAHVVLIAALTWGVNWKQDASLMSAQAELWSAVPQEAAPKPVAAPAAPAPPPPAPQPQVAPKTPDADIALEREKERARKEKQRAEELAAAERREKQAKLEKEKREQQKLAAEKQREADEKLAQRKKELEAEQKRKELAQAQQEAERQEAQRQANLKRIAGLAGATGAPSASGSALQSAGPSSSYAGRISAKIKPNIVFTEDPVGNPTAEVEVRAAPDGKILSRRLVKGSGNKSWDEAVLKAIDKSETLPRDVDGRVPPVLRIDFRPRD